MTVKVEKIVENKDNSVTLTLDLDEETEEIIRKFYKTDILTQQMIEKYIKDSLIMLLSKEEKK